MVRFGGNRGHKYNAKQTYVCQHCLYITPFTVTLCSNGCEDKPIRFDSTREAERYRELKLLERAGVIEQLRLQEPYVVEIKGQKMFTYKADFSYIDDNELEVVEDVKGYRTDMYKLKKKMVEAYYDIEIREI